MFFGSRFDYEHKEFSQFLDDLSVLFGNGLFMNCAVYMHRFMLLFLGATTVSGQQYCNDAANECNLFLVKPSLVRTALANNRTREFVRKRVQEHRETFDPDAIRDFVDIYLDAEMRSKMGGDDDMLYTGRNVNFTIRALCSGTC